MPIATRQGSVELDAKHAFILKRAQALQSHGNGTIVALVIAMQEWETNQERAKQDEIESLANDPSMEPH